MKMMNSTAFDPVAAARRMVELDAEIEAIRERYKLKFRELQIKQKDYLEAFPNMTQEQKQATEERYRKAYWDLLKAQMVAISWPANTYRKLFTQRQNYEFGQRRQRLKRQADMRLRADKRKAG